MVEDGRRGLDGILYLEAEVSGEEPRTFSLPTGTVTFLLSDVEGSTRRWEDHPEAMSIAIPRHYEIMNDAIASNGGVRPVEQGEGDSVVGAFSRASDAVAAALAGQRAMAGEPWPDGAELRVRMSVHTGEAQMRDQGNYVGPTLNRCARIRATGYGGQVLISGTTAVLVADRLPKGATIVDLGQHRLKDLGRPEQIWQVVDPDLPRDFPALKSLDAYRHNLPIQLTPLVGRGGETADAAQLVGRERLVTLTGSAGVGKTRLALAVAAEAVDAHPGGVWWVELAAVADPEAVGRTALAALGGRETGGSAIEQQLAAYLGDQPSLLVLDNCEHLVSACADLVTALLSANPAVNVLTTSREPLGVPGEVTWRVPSMGCPVPNGTISVPALSQFDAVQLFIDRAHRARPSFTVTDANAPSIAQICHRVDGIPLAIELAAARCRQLSPERIATELDNRFRLLTGGARTVMARQQTLLASLEWSHERLDDTERAAFRRLGGFVGPFPLEAAEAVVASIGDIDIVEVFDVVSRLVDKSLVVAEEGPNGALRYRLLETLRAYAIDRARATGELAPIRDAHAAWWADWLEPRGLLPTDANLAMIDEFHTNIAAALDWGADDPLVGLRLLRGVARPWDELGRARDAMSAVDRLLTDEVARDLPDLWLGASEAVALVLDARGLADIKALLERTKRIAGENGDELHGAYAQMLIVVDFDEEPASERVRMLAHATGDAYLELYAALDRALDLADDQPMAAGPLLAAVAADSSSNAFPALRSRAVAVGALLAGAAGELRESIERGLSLLPAGHTANWPFAVRAVGFAGLLAGDETAMAIALDESERAVVRTPGLADYRHILGHRLGLLRGEASVVGVISEDEEAQFSPPTPGTLWLIGRESIDAGAASRAVAWARRHLRRSPHIEAVVAAIEGAALRNEDRWHDVLSAALEHGFRLLAVDALEGLAAGAARSESWTEALRLLGAAQRLRDELGYRWRFGFEQRAVDSARAAAVDALGDADANAAQAEGAGLELPQAAEYARRARGERKRPQHGWASLTPTETQVVALVAEGLTNPQIAERLLMGRATVKTHLEHVFTKLGIRNRSELAAAATRRQVAS